MARFMGYNRLFWRTRFGHWRCLTTPSGHGDTCIASQVKQTAPAARTDVGKKLEDIPGPRWHWLVTVFDVYRRGGFTKGFYRRDEEFVRKYGTLFTVPMRESRQVFVADPGDAAKVLRADPKYPVRFKRMFLNDFMEKYKKESGVFFLNGKEWNKHRSALSKLMLRPPNINSYMPRLNAVGDDMIKRISKVRNGEGHMRKFEIDDLGSELFKWSFEGVTDLLFDRRFGALGDEPPPEAQDFINSVDGFLRNAVTYSFIPPFLRNIFKFEAVEIFESAALKLYFYADLYSSRRMQDVIEKKKLGSEGMSMDTMEELIPFLLSKDIKSEEIVSSIVDTFFAGVDTTANTMAWMLYLLSKNKHKQEILRQEIDKVLPQNEPVSSSTLPRLHYLKATIRETLRLYPVLLTINRVLHQDVVLSGYVVPSGTEVFILSHVMGRREDLFDSPYEFRPERWLRSNTNEDIDAFSSTPFGFGVRMCLGRRFAELELQLLLVKILQRYTLTYPPGEIVERMMRGTNIPDRPVRVQFIER